MEGMQFEANGKGWSTVREAQEWRRNGVSCKQSNLENIMAQKLQGLRVLTTEQSTSTLRTWAIPTILS